MKDIYEVVLTAFGPDVAGDIRIVAELMAVL